MANPDYGPVRPTIRCLTDDLGLRLPPINDPLDTIDHPLVVKAQRTPAEVESGAAKRITSLRDRVWFKQKVQRYRGAVTLLKDTEDRDGWWLGAAGTREAGSPDDVYQDLKSTSERNATSTPQKVDSSWMLPTSNDAKRLELEGALAATLSIRRLIRRLVARSLRTGNPWTIELESHLITAHVTADDGDAYLIVCTEGFIQPELVAVMLRSIPGIPPEDWLPEPGGAVGVEAKSGQIIYSTLIPTAIQDRILDEYPDEGAL